MAKRITAFAAADGTLFMDPAACAEYEKNTLLSAGVAAALSALGVAGAVVVKDGGSNLDSIDLQAFLIANSEVLVEALNNQPPKAPRKPREPKAPVEAGVAAAAVAEAGDIKPIVIKEPETPAPVVETAPVNTDAGAAADAELEALLGGAEAAPGEVAL